MIHKIPKIKFTNKDSFFLIAGPCVIENEKITFKICKELIKITNELEIPFIFKSSFSIVESISATYSPIS